MVACVEDIDYRYPRGLDRALVRRLAEGDWMNRHQNVMITGPTGVGKSFIASALAHAAIRQGVTARYYRMTNESLLQPSGVTPKCLELQPITLMTPYHGPLTCRSTVQIDIRYGDRGIRVVTLPYACCDRVAPNHHTAVSCYRNSAQSNAERRGFCLIIT